MVVPTTVQRLPCWLRIPSMIDGCGLTRSPAPSPPAQKGCRMVLSVHGGIA